MGQMRPDDCTCPEVQARLCSSVSRAVVPWPAADNSLSLWFLPAKPPVYGACKLLDIELEMVSGTSGFYCHRLCIHITAGCWVEGLPIAAPSVWVRPGEALGVQSLQVEEKACGPPPREGSGSGNPGLVRGRQELPAGQSCPVISLNSVRGRKCVGTASVSPSPASHSQGALCLLLP